MTMKKFLAACVVMAAFAASVASVACAQPGEGFGYGKWKIHPVATAQEQYDSNIFLDPSNERHDFITTLAPGLKIDGGFGESKVRASYVAEFNIFSEYSKQNSVNHFADAAIDFNIKDVKVSMGDAFKHVYDRPDTETIQRITRDINDAGISISAEYNRLGWEVIYHNIWTNYETDGYQNENRWDNNINLIGSYRFATKTYFLAEFDYGNVYYIKSVNSGANWYQGLVGLKGQLTAKCTGVVKIGWQYRDYTRSDENDFDSLVTMAGLREEFTPRDILEINWIRSPYESLYTDTNYYIDNSVDLTYTHKFSDVFSANVGGLYRLSQYPSETAEDGTWKKRQDNTWAVRCGIEYKIRKWAIWLLGYEFRQRNSNFSIFDYNDNLVTTSLKVTY